MTKFIKQTFELHNFATIQEVCRIAMDDTKFFAISGETGSGKTKALTYFKSKNEKNTIYIKLSYSMGLRHFFDELASHFDYQFSYKTKYRFIKWIKNYIQDSDENFLLIIDEGGRFSADQYAFIHELRDMTEEKMGIVFAGPKYFMSTLKRWNEKKVNGIPEFYRRVNMIVGLEDLHPDEKVAVCNAYGIKSKTIIRNKFSEINNIGDLTNSIENYLMYKDLNDDRIYTSNLSSRRSKKINLDHA